MQASPSKSAKLYGEFLRGLVVLFEALGRLPLSEIHDRLQAADRIEGDKRRQKTPQSQARRRKAAS